MELTKGEKKYQEFKKAFCKINTHNFDNKNKQRWPSIGCVVVISQESFDKPYSLESRSYVFNSESKAFCPWMGGYSIFSSSINGDDSCRLEWYLYVENGPENGWRIEDCYLVKDGERYDDILKYPGYENCDLFKEQ